MTLKISIREKTHFNFDLTDAKHEVLLLCPCLPYQCVFSTEQYDVTKSLVIIKPQD